MVAAEELADRAAPKPMGLNVLLKAGSSTEAGAGPGVRGSSKPRLSVEESAVLGAEEPEDIRLRPACDMLGSVPAAEILKYVLFKSHCKFAFIYIQDTHPQLMPNSCM